MPPERASGVSRRDFLGLAALWSFISTGVVMLAGALLASVLPFGPFVLDRRLRADLGADLEGAAARRQS